MALLLVMLATLMFAACGGDDDSSSDDSSSDTTTSESTPAGESSTDESASTDTASGAGQTLELGVDGNNLKFDKTSLEATAGSVTIELNNTSSLTHNIGIEDTDGNSLGEGELVGKDETSKVTANLKPGTYTYYCNPHRSAGMTGTLTVT
jgi:plastocyanin